MKYYKNNQHIEGFTLRYSLNFSDFSLTTSNKNVLIKPFNDKGKKNGKIFIKLETLSLVSAFPRA